MDKLQVLPDKPLDYKYLVIGRYSNGSHNIHMGGARTKKEIYKIARMHKYWTDVIIYQKLEEIK